jgi:uncharacterized protein (DUF1778 family)
MQFRVDELEHDLIANAARVVGIPISTRMHQAILAESRKVLRRERE